MSLLKRKSGVEMTKKRNTEMHDGLDQGVLELLGAATVAADLGQDRMHDLRAKVIARLDKDAGIARPNLTIRADEGRWIEVEPLLEKKLLNIDDKGLESYLLRLHPGAAPSNHVHHSDELCIVLEGDVAFDDIRLSVGDCHIARKGSMHGTASTVNGALLFLQAAVHPEQTLCV